MRRRLIRALVGGACLVGSTIHPASVRLALAQPTAESEGDLAKRKDAARVLAKQGLAKIDEGNLEEAIRLLEAAEARFHAPTHLLFLAQANEKLGRLPRAVDLYDALIEETLPDYAPNEFREAQRIGTLARAELLKRVGLVRVIVRGGGGAEEKVSIDGVERAPKKGPYAVEPGPHEVTHGRDGKAMTKHVDVGAGETREVTFEITEKPPAVPRPSPYLMPGVAVLAVGGAALIAGAVTGGLSLKDVAELEDLCPASEDCDDVNRPLYDEAKNLGNASTALFAVGGVAAAIGIVLLVLPSPEPRAPLRATLGLGGFVVSGSF